MYNFPLCTTSHPNTDKQSIYLSINLSSKLIEMTNFSRTSKNFYLYPSRLKGAKVIITAGDEYVTLYDIKLAPEQKKLSKISERAIDRTNKTTRNQQNN